MQRIAVFLDRDGVLNKKPAQHDYVKSFEEFEWNKNAKQLVREICKRGYLAIVVSNQRGISRGMMSREFVDTLHTKINDDLKIEGSHITSFYICEHDYAANCVCRKPNPGLFHRALRDFDIDITQSYMIGDSATDIEAAQKAGCKKAIFIKSDTIDLDYLLQELV